MATVYNAMQLRDGARVKRHAGLNLTQPVQFLPRKEKDQDWAASNMDWLEMVGLRQVQAQAPRMLKNYKLANGIIDRSDYIVSEDNEVGDLVDQLTRGEDCAMEIKFFPLIPNAINVMLGEFSKRSDKVLYRAVDNNSYNEMLENKRGMIEQVLLSQAEQKLIDQMIQQGMDFEDPQVAQSLEPEQLKTLPEIENFFKKDYRSIPEQWSTHQHLVDTERFRIKELELTAFRDMLTVDTEIWHFRMMDDDYELELWNPLLSFCHKSPEVPYFSQGNRAGRFEMMTVADVIDKYGYKMTREQLESLAEYGQVSGMQYTQTHRYQNDGGFYDPSKSHAWNTNMPSLAMRQYQAVSSLTDGDGDVMERILNHSDDLLKMDDPNLMRVMTGYWKSQRLVYHLTEIDENGGLRHDIVSEEYKVTAKPIYNTTLQKKKSVENLIYGQHLEGIWINETWGGLKIGRNSATPSAVTAYDANFTPIYLDVKPVRFQFKGDFTLYGCKLPVEGCSYSQRNTHSVGFVDRMKPAQIGFNLVNNQLSDILVDELGTIIVLDQNALPQHSMGEDWGKHNYQNAYMAMRNFNMLPLDTTITNTESAMNFQHYQVLNMEQTGRLMSRVQLANYFRQQAFEVIGMSPERMGSVNAHETAKGVTEAVNNSYVQTEMYFVQHSEHLMPRVHQMRTDLAQYYHSRKPSVRLQYMRSSDETVNFEINGTQLLNVDLNLFVTTSVNHRFIMEQMRQLALGNNTSGATIYDLGKIIKAESVSEIDTALKAVEEKMQANRQAEQNHEQQLEQMKQEGEDARLAAEQAFEAEQNELERENKIDVAEVRSAGFTGMQDFDGNQQSDYIDTLKYLDQKHAKDAELGFRRETEVNRVQLEREAQNLKREELATRRSVEKDKITVARTNKNKYDRPAPKKKK